jgi:hypothetical protein
MKKTALLLILLLSSLAKGQFWENPNQKPSLFGMRINRGHILGDPVAYWPFSEGFASKVFDLSGNGNTGTLQGTSPSWSAGKFGPAVDLPGDDEYIDIPGTPALNGDLSIAFIVTPENTTSLDYILDFSGANEFACIKGFQNGFYNVYGGAYPTGIAADSQIPMSGAEVTDFIVWTKKGTNLKGYVNGKQECSVTISQGDFIPSAGLEVGRNYGAVNLFDGGIEYLAIYNRALAAGEIALLYREPFCYMMEPNWDMELYGWMTAPVVGAGQVIFIMN